MNSYTLLWNNETWDQYKKLPNKPISYIAGNKLPEIKKGDEIFIVSVKGQHLFIGGRLIASGMKIDRVAASNLLAGESLIDKEKYVVADKTKLDYFRANISLDSDAVREIEIYKSPFEITNCKFSITSFQQDFRSPKRISDKSATEFRRLLKIELIDPAEVDAAATNLVTDELPEKRVMREILARRGQPRFRNELLAVYDSSCCVTGCKLVELLEAAHIEPHSDGGDYSLHNGLLLRSDIHTLFDQYLFAIDEYNRIKVSKKLLDSEYKKFHMERLYMPRPSAVPSKDALARRYSEFIKREMNR